MTSMLEALKQIRARDAQTSTARPVPTRDEPEATADDGSQVSPPGPQTMPADARQLFVGWHGIAASTPCEVPAAPFMTPPDTDPIADASPGEVVVEPCGQPICRAAKDDVPASQEPPGNAEAEPSGACIGEPSQAISPPSDQQTEDQVSSSAEIQPDEDDVSNDRAESRPESEDELAAFDVPAAQEAAPGYAGQLRPIPEFEVRIGPDNAASPGHDQTAITAVGGFDFPPAAEKAGPVSILESLPADELMIDEDGQFAEIGSDAVGLAEQADLSGEELLHEIEQLLLAGHVGAMPPAEDPDHAGAMPPAEDPDDNAVVSQTDAVPDLPLPDLPLPDLPPDDLYPWGPDEWPQDAFDPIVAAPAGPPASTSEFDEEGDSYVGEELAPDSPRPARESPLGCFAAAVQAAADGALTDGALMDGAVPDGALTDGAAADGAVTDEAVTVPPPETTDPDPLTIIDFSQAAISTELAYDTAEEMHPLESTHAAPVPTEIAPESREVTDFELEICDNLEHPATCAQYDELWSALRDPASTKPPRFGQLGKLNFWSARSIEPRTDIRTVLLAGVEPEPHVADVLAHLAVYLCTRCRLRVLVVDGDLDASSLSERFGMSASSPGLADTCFGGSASPTIDKTATGPEIVSAGSPHAESANFQPDRITRFLASQTAIYDIILVHGGTCEGPLFHLAAACDRMFLVARLGKTPRRAAAGRVKALLGSGINVCGCVVTNA